MDNLASDLDLTPAINLITDAIKNNDYCPTNNEIATSCGYRSGASGVRIFRRLNVQRKIVVVDTRPNGGRQVKIPGIGETKALPPKPTKHGRQVNPKSKKPYTPTKSDMRDDIGEPLGTQDPKGCRMIYGDPPGEGWRYCSRKPWPYSTSPWCKGHHEVAHGNPWNEKPHRSAAVPAVDVKGARQL